MNCSIASLWCLLGAAVAARAAGPPGPGGVGGAYGGMVDPSYNRTASDDRAMRAAYGAVWRDIKSNAENLQKSLGLASAEAASLLTQLQTNALFLEAKWDVWSRNHTLPGQYQANDPYLLGLRGDDHVLSKLKKEKDPSAALGLLRDVALDVQLKADNCRNSGDGLGKQIKVKVHTKAGDKEVGGYEVFFVSKGMLDVKSAHDRFPRQSSPTDEKILSPGGYAMWVRKKGFTSEPITLSIGGHGEKNLEVDIPVPSE